MSLPTWNASATPNSSSDTNPGGSSDPPITGAPTMRTRPIDYMFAIVCGLALGTLIALGI